MTVGLNLSASGVLPASLRKVVGSHYVIDPLGLKRMVAQNFFVIEGLAQ